MKDVKVTKSSEGFTKYNNATHMEGNGVANQINLCKETAKALNEQNTLDNKTDERRGKQIMRNDNKTNTALAYMTYYRSTIGSKQQSAIEKYSDAHDITIEQTYVDNECGHNGTRPGFQKLKKDIESGKVTSKVILVHSIGKVSRDIITLLDEIEWCEKHGVKIMGAADGADISKKYDMFPYLLCAASRQ